MKFMPPLKETLLSYIQKHLLWLLLRNKNGSHILVGGTKEGGKRINLQILIEGHLGFQNFRVSDPAVTHQITYRTSFLAER